MKFLAKYGIGIYLLITLVFKLYFIVPIALTNGIYYFLMIFGLISFPFYSKSLFTNKIVFKSFVIFFSVNALNLIYFLFFDRTSESSLYLLAKFAAYNLIVLGVVSNYTYYKSWFTRYFKYMMLIMVILGKIFGTVVASNELQRLSLGFNPNDVGLFGMLGVLSIITMDKLWHKKMINIVLFIFFILMILLSGSKAALLSLVLGLFLNYGFNYRIVISVFFFLIIAYFSSNLGYITSIDRLNSKEGAFETREEVYDIGLKTAQDNIWLGHGLDKYGWTNPMYWDYPELALGPHNTYLSIVIMYGVVFGFVFLISILKFVFKTFKMSFRSDDYFIRFCYFIVLIVLVNGIFETLIVGLNEFITLLFWFAVGCIGYNFIILSKNNSKKVTVSKNNLELTLRV
ncbi:MAG: O-antigen ligase family protein [Lutibacter sp.]|nr:O-antigen ligase family protein [Lutibacter sp.]